MEDEVLITLVQNYEELYNLKHSQYSNLQRRDNIWEEIGDVMKLSGEFLVLKIQCYVEIFIFYFR